LQIRVDSIVRDGTNRVGDLEFRLCELEPDCDIASLGETPNLGGVEPSARPVQSSHRVSGTGGGPQLAVAEQDDFDRARAAFDAGDYAAAAAALRGLHPDLSRRPLERRGAFPARRGRGAAGRMEPRRARLSRQLHRRPGRPPGAGGADCAGRSLGRLGQVEEACVTLAEVAVRYPGDPAVGRGEAERFNLGCS
jgi:hypothetical protein